MQLQLLTAALRRRPEFNAFSCPLVVDMLLQAVATSSPDVLVFATNGNNSNWEDLALLRRLHLAYPKVVQILLVESVDRELVVKRFVQECADCAASPSIRFACSANVSRSSTAGRSGLTRNRLTTCLSR